MVWSHILSLILPTDNFCHLTFFSLWNLLDVYQFQKSFQRFDFGFIDFSLFVCCFFVSMILLLSLLFYPSTWFRIILFIFSHFLRENFRLLFWSPLSFLVWEFNAIHSTLSTALAASHIFRYISVCSVQNKFKFSLKLFLWAVDYLGVGFVISKWLEIFLYFSIIDFYVNYIICTLYELDFIYLWFV